MVDLISDTLKQLITRRLGIPTNPFAANIEIDNLSILTARVLIHQIKSRGTYENIHDAEFKVFSQFGEDGIIQYLIHNVQIENEAFIEFGVADYRESNTRFLLINNNWRGLVIDSGRSNIERIIKDPIYWKFELQAVHDFVNRDNIDRIIRENNFSGDIGLLCIDIDGNDYWVWESIQAVSPTIVIVEYNSIFGNRRAVTIPYDASFERSRAHYSDLFWGCSLKALCMLAERKDYAFVGSNSNGNNAFFVRKDKLGNLKTMDIESGYVESRFRESRDLQGRLSYLSGSDRLKAIGEMQVYDLESNTLIRIESLAE